MLVKGSLVNFSPRVWGWLGAAPIEHMAVEGCPLRIDARSACPLLVRIWCLAKWYRERRMGFCLPF